MNDLTRENDRLLSEGKALLRDNREGGRHRRAPSIGQGSAKVKRDHLMKKVRNIALALFGIWVGMGVLGVIVDGIGFLGVMALIVASVVAIGVLGNYPRMKTPKRADINKGNVQQMVSRTELWLEAQRPALPPPAVKIVDDMGVQLDALGLQLETIDQQHPAAREVRSLVGDVLPETIDAYRKIPQHLRGEKRAGATPDEQLTASLGKISKEIDHVTRQLAEGSLDDLAIKNRFLEYKYGEGEETSNEPG